MPQLNVIYRHRAAGTILTNLSDYRRAGGYEALRTALTTMEPDEVLYSVVRSGLRGRGGAGFPTGRKASFLPKDSDRPSYVVCNADESEPGTFKDREIIERNPFQLLEGVAIAGYAIGAKRGYIYIRGEYDHQANVLQEALTEARRAGFLGQGLFGTDVDFDITIYRGAGAYICGEETALLESLEGKRGQPRLKPPFPAVAGLYQSPTLINNVETLTALPPIIERGPDWYAALGGAEKSPGTKVFCVSGHVMRPGNYEVVLHETTLRELIYDMAGGFRPGHEFKACWVGGSSVPVLGADALDTPLDYESLNGVGTFLGSAGCIVMDDSGCIVRACLRLAHFYRHESCGKCSPCREGTGWLENILQRMVDGNGRMEDLELLERIFGRMFGRTLCALADGAVMPLRSALALFRDEFVQVVEHGSPRPEPMMEATAGA
ncbi:MAG TPA: NADH-quinone oxidoreductase subunit NuoF [Miltoncostaeaceae bacterium]|nr:NADH-quinone oxidoreductase subunit NuoF [Miltoncostaeaceae bacterium]